MKHIFKIKRDNEFLYIPLRKILLVSDIMHYWRCVNWSDPDKKQEDEPRRGFYIRLDNKEEYYFIFSCYKEAEKEQKRVIRLLDNEYNI